MIKKYGVAKIEQVYEINDETKKVKKDAEKKENVLELFLDKKEDKK